MPVFCREKAASRKCLQISSAGTLAVGWGAGKKPQSIDTGNLPKDGYIYVDVYAYVFPNSVLRKGKSH